MSQTLYNVSEGGLRNRHFAADTPEEAVEKYKVWAKDLPLIRGSDGESKPVATKLRDLGEKPGRPAQKVPKAILEEQLAQALGQLAQVKEEAAQAVEELAQTRRELTQTAEKLAQVTLELTQAREESVQVPVVPAGPEGTRAPIVPAKPGETADGDLFGKPDDGS